MTGLSVSAIGLKTPSVKGGTPASPVVSGASGVPSLAAFVDLFADGDTLATTGTVPAAKRQGDAASGKALPVADDDQRDPALDWLFAATPTALPLATSTPTPETPPVAADPAATPAAPATAGTVAAIQLAASAPTIAATLPDAAPSVDPVAEHLDVPAAQAAPDTRAAATLSEPAMPDLPDTADTVAAARAPIASPLPAAIPAAAAGLSLPLPLVPSTDDTPAEPAIVAVDGAPTPSVQAIRPAVAALAASTAPSIDLMKAARTVASPTGLEDRLVSQAAPASSGIAPASSQAARLPVVPTSPARAAEAPAVPAQAAPVAAPAVDTAAVATASPAVAPIAGDAPIVQTTPVVADTVAARPSGESVAPRQSAEPQAATSAQPRTAPLPAPAPTPATTAQPAAAAMPALFALAPQALDRRDDKDVGVTGLSTTAALVQTTGATAPITAPGGAQHQTLDMNGGDWPQRMIDRIETLRDAANANDTSIRLKPDALGRIDVAIRHQGDGAISVHFTAETTTARTLIADAAPQLSTAAEARGIRLSGTSVDLAGSGLGQGQGGSGQQARQQFELRHNTSNRLASGEEANQAVDDGRIA